MMEIKMKIPFSEIQILSQYEALFEAAANSKKYNIISIFSTNPKRPNLFKPNFYNHPKSICFKSFDDIVDITRQQYADKEFVLCNKWDIQTILDFAKLKYGEPLLVHCHAGISRSPSITFAILLDYLKDKSENPVEEALEMLIQIKSPDLIRPNKYIISLGFHVLAENPGQEIEWLKIFYNSETTKRIYGN